MKTLRFYLFLCISLSFITGWGQNIYKSEKFGHQVTFPTNWEPRKLMGGEYAIGTKDGIEYSVSCYKANFKMATKISAKSYSSARYTAYTMDDYQIARFDGPMKSVEGPCNGVFFHIQKQTDNLLYTISVQSYTGNMPDTALVQAFVNSFTTPEGFKFDREMVMNILDVTNTETQEITIETENTRKSDFGIYGGVSFPEGDLSESRMKMGWDIAASYGYFISPKFLAGLKVGYSSWGDDGSFVGEFQKDLKVTKQTGNVTYLLLDGSFLFGKDFDWIVGAGLGHYSMGYETTMGSGDIFTSTVSGFGLAPKVGFSTMSLGPRVYFSAEFQLHLCPDECNFLTMGLGLHF